MKIRSFFLAVCLLMVGVASLFAEQTTEGRDFWLTMMRSADNDPATLSLTIATKQACAVTVVNPTTGYRTQQNLAANAIGTITVNKNDCYVADNENGTVSQKALHVTSTADISLIAANYRVKSFDVAAILPVPTLLDDYYIQCYTPSDHEDKPQGSHFAVVATENNTVVSITPSVAVKGHAAGVTFQTPVMNAGDVYYLWTEKTTGKSADLSGTHVQALNNKRIAVFNGNPHTNVPYQVRDRDHLYSQAVPTAYWGTRFPVTASLTTDANGLLVERKRDKVRVMALYDGTQVYVNGSLIHTFDFVNGSDDDKHHFYEFDLGQSVSNIPIIEGKNSYCPPTNQNFIQGTSCYVETSCPSAVHLFLASNTYDYPGKDFDGKSTALCNGDPAMVWINPIEQVISDITFGVFNTAQVQDHFVNVVTDSSNVKFMQLDGTSISTDFAPLNGNPRYSFARLKIGNSKHQLTGKNGFIAHVYGFGERESYGYPAGSAARTSLVYVDNNLRSSGDTVSICYGDSVEFASYVEDFQSMLWDMADGTTRSDSAFKYMYDAPGIYDVECYVQRDDPCRGILNIEDTIHLRVKVNIPRYYTRYAIECQQATQGNHQPMVERVDTVEYGCDSVVYRYVNTYYTADTTLKVRAEDSYDFFGQTITSSCVKDTVLMRVGSGCDSTVHYDIKIVECLHLTVPTDMGKICPDGVAQLEIPYTLTRGTFSAVEAAFTKEGTDAGFVNGPLQSDAQHVFIPVPDKVHPGKYSVTLTFADDAECNVDNVKTVDFYFYLAGAVAQKWQDVLAVYNERYNGGYIFNRYQWYRNDSIIDGANSSVLYVPGGLDPNSYYTVEMACIDGQTYVSCPLTPDFSSHAAAAPGRAANGEADTTPTEKVIYNGTLYIVRDGQLFDVWGRPINK